MLTVILYGRNDQHGYNYHKRAAISINCLAELLTDSSDEILFADYNTSEDLPTLFETIQDTLTEKAKIKLKIFRVRNEHHLPFVSVTPLELLEPQARNIAIRRSNQNNRWILSTNSDMIFIPHDSKESLTSIVDNLLDGFYTLPRFELPEYFWESCFERDQPQKNIALLNELGKKLHLQNIIENKPYIGYDNVGDFQLMLRKDIFKLGGFDEDMLWGWHVDSNLSKRMYLLYGELKNLRHKLSGYHCNHTKKKTFLHTENGVGNCWFRFVEEVDSYVTNSHKAWGIPEKYIEEVNLDGSKSPCHHYLAALSSVQMRIAPKQYKSNVNFQFFNQLFYPSAQIFSYLTDHLANIPKKSKIVYIGYNHTLLKMLIQFWSALGGTEKILLPHDIAMPKKINKESVKYINLKDLSENNHIYIFDFGYDEKFATDNKKFISHKKLILANIIKIFLYITRYERKHKSSRTFIGINVVNTDFQPFFRANVNCQIAGRTTNINYGHVNIAPKSEYSSRYYLKYCFRCFRREPMQFLHYLSVRYFLKYSDKIRNSFLLSKLLKNF